MTTTGSTKLTRWKWHYPHTTVLDYGYGVGPASPSSDFIISRLVSLGFDGPTVAKYDHVGLSMYAEVDLADIDVQYDRTASHTGERQTQSNSLNPGRYPGFDRFGRVVQDLWVDGDFTTGTPPNPNVPPIVEYTYSYDAASNRLKRDNLTATIQWPFRDETLSYDGLDRLEKSLRGVRSGPGPGDPFTSFHTTSESWGLDALGNWDELLTDNNGDGTFGQAGEQEPRTHNAVNELEDRDPGGAGVLNLNYDKAGNLTDEETVPGTSNTLLYTHDAWNRLVEVEFDDGGGAVPRAQYAFNGLNWRTMKRADTTMPFDGTLDEERLMYYSSGWQLLEERIDDDLDAGGGTIDRHVQYVWGPRYIDDIVLHRQDAGADGSYENTWYHMTDAQFSTVAIIDDMAVLKERVSYTPYGEARHHRAADLDGDGATSTSDRLILYGNWGGFGVGDVDRDGTVGTSDDLFLLADWGAALAPGVLSSSTVDNQIGYDGYVFNAETLQYCVRFRTYDPMLGRWLERDPLVYVDGMNRYQNVSSSPCSRVDPYGLQDALGSVKK